MAQMEGLSYLIQKNLYLLVVFSSVFIQKNSCSHRYIQRINMSLHRNGYDIIAVFSHKVGHAASFASHYDCRTGGEFLAIGRVSLHICAIDPEAILFQCLHFPVEVCNNGNRKILGGP